MSISVLRSARWVFSVMAVTVFSALVLVGCGNDDDPPVDTTKTPTDDPVGEWNGSYKGDLWVNGTIVSDDQNNLGIAVVSGGNTVKITFTGVDVTFKFGALTKVNVPTDSIPAGYTNVERYTAPIDGGGVATFQTASAGGKTYRLLYVTNGKSGDKTYNFSGSKQ